MDDVYNSSSSTSTHQVKIDINGDIIEETGSDNGTPLFEQIVGIQQKYAHDVKIKQDLYSGDFSSSILNVKYNYYQYMYSMVGNNYNDDYKMRVQAMYSGLSWMNYHHSMLLYHSTSSSINGQSIYTNKIPDILGQIKNGK